MNETTQIPYRYEQKKGTYLGEDDTLWVVLYDKPIRGEVYTEGSIPLWVALCNSEEDAAFIVDRVNQHADLVASNASRAETIGQQAQEFETLKEDRDAFQAIAISRADTISRQTEAIAGLTKDRDALVKVIKLDALPFLKALGAADGQVYGLLQEAIEQAERGEG